MRARMASAPHALLKRPASPTTSVAEPVGHAVQAGGLQPASSASVHNTTTGGASSAGYAGYGSTPQGERGFSLADMAATAAEPSTKTIPSDCRTVVQPMVRRNIRVIQSQSCQIVEYNSLILSIGDRRRQLARSICLAFLVSFSNI